MATYFHSAQATAATGDPVASERTNARFRRHRTQAWRFSTAVAIIAATGLLSLTCLASPITASAANIYSIKNGTVPSGPNQGADEPGPGARITNKAYGYYIGRAMPGARFTQVGGRASHYYGRIVGGNNLNTCGWVHRSARGKKIGHGSAICSKLTANRIWQRLTIGRDFSATAGTRGHSGVRVAVRKSCHLYYNYFSGTNFATGKLRDRTGLIGTRSTPSHTVQYRYRTIDGKAVVVLDDKYGWGFTRPDCLDLNIPKFNDPDIGLPPQF